MKEHSAIRKIETEIFNIIVEPGRGRFNVRFSDSYTLRRCVHPKFTLIFNDPFVLAKILIFRNDYITGKAFVDQRIDVRGDLFEAMTLSTYFENLHLTPVKKIRILGLLCFIGIRAAWHRLLVLLSFAPRTAECTGLEQGRSR